MASKSLNNIVEFYDNLDTAEEIFHDKGDGKKPNQKPIIMMIYTNYPHQLEIKIRFKPGRKNLGRGRLKTETILTDRFTYSYRIWIFSS